MHIVGFIIRIYHDARSPEQSNSLPANKPMMNSQWQLYKRAWTVLTPYQKLAI